MYVRDHFLRFYYRFIVPQLGPIERGYHDAVATKIYAELRPFLAQYVFEELCREWVWAAAMAGRLDFTPEQVGAAPREKRLLIGEAKWGREPLSRHLLPDLIKCSQRMPQAAAGWTAQYALFARAGFTEALQAEAVERGATLISLEDLEETLRIR